jgi:hypothetical protein
MGDGHREKEGGVSALLYWAQRRRRNYDGSQESPGMASDSPEHHMDRLGYRLGDRSDSSVLAAEERIENSRRWSLARSERPFARADEVIE